MQTGSSGILFLRELDAMIARAESACEKLRLAASDANLDARKRRRVDAEWRTMTDIAERLRATRRSQLDE